MSRRNFRCQHAAPAAGVGGATPSRPRGDAPGGIRRPGIPPARRRGSGSRAVPPPTSTRRRAPAAARRAFRSRRRRPGWPRRARRRAARIPPAATRSEQACPLNHRSGSGRPGRFRSASSVRHSSGDSTGTGPAYPSSPNAASRSPAIERPHPSSKRARGRRRSAARAPSWSSAPAARRDPSRPSRRTAGVRRGVRAGRRRGRRSAGRAWRAPPPGTAPGCARRSRS